MDWEQIRLLAFDLDGTSVEDGRLGECAVVALDRFVRAGRWTVCASGRTFSVQQEIFARSGIRPQDGYPHYLIACDKFIYRLCGSEYVSEESWNAPLRQRWSCLLPQVLARLPHLEKALAEARLEFVIVGDHLLHEEAGYFPLQFVDVAAAERAMGVMAKVYSGIPDFAVNRNGPYVAATLRHAGKGETLEVICRELQVVPEEVLAVGDSFNDLSMLDGRFGYRSAAVANGEKIVQKAVRANRGYVATRPGPAGFAEILNSILARHSGFGV